MNHIEEPAKEGFLYHLWLERVFSKTDLLTVDGQRIEILEKGTRNYDAGPDFRDALIRINDELRRGDVEIHPLAGDWYGHGHHRDPKYNNVILHLVTFDCPSTFRTLRADGFYIPTLNMDDYLEKSAEELEMESQPCSVTPLTECALSREERSTIRLTIEKAGDQRLEAKAGRFLERTLSMSWDELFYHALCEALGFSKNQIPFRQLAEILPLETLWNLIWNDPQEMAAIKCEAYLFGVAGLLPSQSVPSSCLSSDHYIQELESAWRRFPLRNKLPLMKAGSWQFFRLRPANFPTRRIAAAAALICKFRDDGFGGFFQRILNDNSLSIRKKITELEGLFCLPSAGFWINHFSFEESPHELIGDNALLGVDRARDMVINVVLPGTLAFAKTSSDGKLKNVVKEIYYHYPRHTANEVTRAMCRQLFDVDDSPQIVNSARIQQGLIQLRKNYCRPTICALCLQGESFGRNAE